MCCCASPTGITMRTCAHIYTYIPFYIARYIRTFDVTHTYMNSILYTATCKINGNHQSTQNGPDVSKVFWRHTWENLRYSCILQAAVHTYVHTYMHACIHAVPEKARHGSAKRQARHARSTQQRPQRGRRSWLQQHRRSLQQQE
jgi:hypothetical protein